MNLRMYLSFLILFVYQLAGAQVPSNMADRDLYNQLTADLYAEVLTMDAVTESGSERNAMILQLQQVLQSKDPNNFRFSPGNSWSHIWPPSSNLQKVRFDSGPQSFQFISAPKELLKQNPHSIHELDSYIGARLGKASAEMIKSGKIVPIVIGGSSNNIGSLLKASPDKVYKVASFYESWGIEKYYVSSSEFSDGKPRLVFVVPPIFEYLKHYQYMLTLLTGREQLVARSKEDYKSWRTKMKESTTRLLKKVGTFDHAVIGYYNQWIELLSSKTSNYRILTQSPLSNGSEGQFAVRLQVQHKENLKVAHLVIMGSNKTIWGEAAAAITEGILPLNPSGIIFLGSAGSLNNKVKVYDLSVPVSFQSPGQKIEIVNFIQNNKKNSVLAVDTNYSTTHTSTYSPAEQTKDFVESRRHHGADTLDVEQNLVAKEIASYNQKHQTQIRFGAINLITDKPLSSEDFDLDKIDHSKKAKSRLAAVQLSLDSIFVSKSAPMSCRKIHL